MIDPDLVVVWDGSMKISLLGSRPERTGPTWQKIVRPKASHSGGTRGHSSRVYSQETREAFRALVDRGCSLKVAAHRLGVVYLTARDWSRGRSKP